MLSLFFNLTLVFTIIHHFYVFENPYSSPFIEYSVANPHLELGWHSWNAS